MFNNTYKLLKNALLYGATALAMYGCGGGSGGDTTTNTSGNTNNPTYGPNYITSVYAKFT